MADITIEAEGAEAKAAPDLVADFFAGEFGVMKVVPTQQNSATHQAFTET